MIYVMRHLERAAGADPGLSAAGAGHAEQLASWFGHNRPVAIFVTPFRRARDTVAPLAARLRIAPTEYDPSQVGHLVEAVSAVNGPVLIVGHSNTVPAIVRALGGAEFPDLSDTDYGQIWFVRDSGQTVRVTSLALPQPP